MHEKCSHHPNEHETVTIPTWCSQRINHKHHNHKIRVQPSCLHTIEQLYHKLLSRQLSINYYLCAHYHRLLLSCFLESSLPPSPPSSLQVEQPRQLKQLSSRHPELVQNWSTSAPSLTLPIASCTVPLTTKSSEDSDAPRISGAIP